MSHQPPYQGSCEPGSRAPSGTYEYSLQNRPSQLMDDSKMDFGSFTAASSSGGGEFRYASHSRPEALPSLQPPTGASSMSLLSSSNATTPRQSAFARDQVDRPPQLSLALPQGMCGSTSLSGGAAAAASSSTAMRLSYFDAGAGVGAMGSGEMAGSSFADPSRSMQLQSASSSSAAAAAAAAWQQSSLHRASFNSIGSSTHSGYASSDAGGMMLPPATASFAYDSSSENNSPIRPPGYYDALGSHFSPYGGGGGSGSHAYAATYGGKNGALEQPYGISGHPAAVSTSDIDNALRQISSLYKSATTKKNAEFYRDKWARIWLSCNYTLKASIQISIPRTILHESYRRACESFGVEPLQAASFGKVLRGQFPDVAQRRLGGRGKTRFHYCGFGTANQREAIAIKQLLDDEKAGRLQLSVGMSAEYAQEGRSRSTTSNGDDAARGYAPLDASAHGRHLQFVTPGQYSGQGQSQSGVGESQADKMAASAFATLNGSMAAASAQQNQQLQHHQHGSSPSYMPRRHTLSTADGSCGAMLGGSSGDSSFDSRHSTVAGHGFAASGGTSSGIDGGGGGASHPHRLSRGGDSFGHPSENNSPSLSMHGHLSRPQSVANYRRSCRDLSDWPNPEEGDSTLNAASFHLSMKGKIAWKEYEAMCQDLLHAIHYGPDLAAFDRRSTSFWSSLSQDSQEAMRNEPTLCELILRGDAVIVRQLLVRLDDMIGDDISDERTASLGAMAMSMSSRLQNLLEGRLPASFVKAKVQACEKLAENLERIAGIYESIKQFREHSLPEPTSDRHYPDTHTLAPPSFPSTSSSHADILGPHQAVFGGGSSTKTPFAFQGSQQARRRDDSIGSSVSDSHYTWLSGEQQYSSSASESDFSLHSAPVADSGHGGHGGSSLFGSMAAPVARKWSGQRMRMSSGPPSRSTGNSEISGPVSSSLSGMALGGSHYGGGGSHRATPSASPRTSALDSHSLGGSHSASATTQHPASSSSVSTHLSPLDGKEGHAHGSLGMYSSHGYGSETTTTTEANSTASTTAAAAASSASSEQERGQQDQPMDQAA